ncbi:iron-sulfur cluster carrier protein ApbC [Pseudomonadota bacterium]
MFGLSEKQVESAIKKYIDPYTKQDFVTAKTVRTIKIDGERVTVDILLGYPAKSRISEIQDELQARVLALKGVSEAHIKIRSQVDGHVAQKGVTAIPQVKNVIAVASGKGGVGKSTVAVNLALALSAEGASVGILDADIYGPSQPRMLGITGKPESRDGKSMEPMLSYEIQAMSIGFLIEEETPMIWRGPMVTQALEQLSKDTNWKKLDYLIIDLPPGTGDIQLTLAQRIPVTGALIVTTPQDIALLDARKAVKMFEKVEIPVLGVVENMSTHICSECGHEEHIFGKGGAERMAADYDIDYLGGIPLDMRIREDVDNGRPTVVTDPDGPIAETYKSVARHLGAKISLGKKDHSTKFPGIVVQNN